MSDWFHWQGQDLHLALKVQPRAGKDEFVAGQDGYLKVRITAPPVDGKANQHLIRLLARTFKGPQHQIALTAGETGRLKRFVIHAPRVMPGFMAENRGRL